MVVVLLFVAQAAVGHGVCLCAPADASELAIAAGAHACCLAAQREAGRQDADHSGLSDAVAGSCECGGQAIVQDQQLEVVTDRVEVHQLPVPFLADSAPLPGSPSAGAALARGPPGALPGADAARRSLLQTWHC